MSRISGLIGFCYTQLTDVEQETNRLLYVDWTSKLEMERISAHMAEKEKING